MAQLKMGNTRKSRPNLLRSCSATSILKIEKKLKYREWEGVPTFLYIVKIL